MEPVEGLDGMRKLRRWGPVSETKPAVGCCLVVSSFRESFETSSDDSFPSVGLSAIVD